MRKLLSVILVLVTMLSVFSVTASAETSAKGIFDDETYYDVLIDDVYYLLENGVGAVTGFDMDLDDTSPKAGITIPETVTYGGKDFTIIMIFDMAFMECDYTSITLPSTITYIGDGAFMSSPYLEKVVIPNDCEFEYFGAEVFTGTPFEAEIYSKDETIFGKNVLFSYIGNADEYVIPENINIIVPKAFFMSGIKNIVFNNNVTDIPAYAFASCRNLTEVTIPDAVTVIADGAFMDCFNLEKINFGENVWMICEDAFANTKIKSIHLGINVAQITGAFKNCNMLESITIEPGNTSFVTDGNAVYQKTNISEGYKTREVLMLEYYIPSKAQGDINLKSDVYVISDYAFYGCKNIGEVKANELTHIGYSAFENSSITKFSANGDYYIFDSAFKNCKNLQSINLENIRYIDTAAFENCTSLKNVTFSKDIAYIGPLAFSNTGLTEVVIYGDYCEIHEGAFKNCANLQSVRLEEGVYYVGMDAFLGCPKLETIYLSKTVKSFAENAFNGCDNVTFELVKGTDAYDYIDDNTDFNIETVGRYSLWQRIIDFFRALFGLD